MAEILTTEETTGSFTDEKGQFCVYGVQNGTVGIDIYENPTKQKLVSSIRNLKPEDVTKVCSKDAAMQILMAWMVASFRNAMEPLKAMAELVEK